MCAYSNNTSSHTDLCSLSAHQAGKGVVHAMCERVFLQDEEQAGVVEVAGHGRDELLHSLSLSLLQTCQKHTHSQKSGTRWHQGPFCAGNLIPTIRDGQLMPVRAVNT